MKIKDNIALLNNIDFCVVNGGYSALSELFWAEVPMIVIQSPIILNNGQTQNKLFMLVANIGQ